MDVLEIDIREGARAIYTLSLHDALPIYVDVLLHGAADIDGDHGGGVVGAGVGGAHVCTAVTDGGGMAALDVVELGEDLAGLEELDRAVVDGEAPGQVAGGAAG